MDLIHFIFLKVFFITIINVGTPTLCNMAAPGQDDVFEGDFSVKDYSLNNSTETLKTQSEEPVTTGTVEVTVDQNETLDVKFPDGNYLTKDNNEVLDNTSESSVLSESTEQNKESNDEDDAEAFMKSDTTDKSESMESDDLSENNLSESVAKYLFGEFSTEYADDYKKSVDEGKAMDPNKEYYCKTISTPDSIMVLATPSGCALMELQNDEQDSFNVVEFKFKVSNLDDCGKLTKEIVYGIKNQLSSELALNKTPETKMVEISVRDPMRNRQLNVMETTQVFTSGNRSKESAKSDSSSSRFDSDKEFEDFLDEKYGMSLDEQDREALELLSDNLDVQFIPTSLDTVFAMSYTLRGLSPEELKRDQLMNDFFNLFDTVLEAASKTEAKSVSKTEKSEQEDENKSSENEEEVSQEDMKTTREDWFKKLQNLPTDMFEKFLDDARKLLETKEGKEAVEKLGQELEKQFKETEEFVKKEITLGRQILEDLSKHGMENVECSKLTNEDCSKYSKCQVMKVEDKDMCFVSPKTIYWLMGTNCGLQTRPALLSIARDLQNVGYLSPKTVNNLASTFNSDKICKVITHSYLSRLSPKEDQQPNNAFN